MKELQDIFILANNKQNIDVSKFRLKLSKTNPEFQLN